MLHDVNEPIRSAEQAMLAEYQRVVNASGDEAIDIQRAISDAADQVQYLIDNGMVREPDMREALKSIGKSIDRKQGQSADKILAKLARGQVHLFEDDSFLTTVVTLGGGMRKTWRYITGQDLIGMREERRKNVKAAVESLDSFEHDFNSVIETVMAYTTVGAAAVAGAFSKAVAA